MLQARSLSALEGIRHAFFTREGGVSDGVYASLNGGIGSNDKPDNVWENRARMAAALSVAPERFVTTYQVHSPEVVTVETPWPLSERPRADAMVTRTPGIALGISTADCGPVLFADAFDVPEGPILDVSRRLNAVLGFVDSDPVLLPGANFDFESAEGREHLPPDTVWYMPADRSDVRA